MDKAFQHDYAKAVSLFVQKVPAEVPVTTQEIDAYFRQCVLYLMSFDEAMKNDPNSGIINQLYTEDPVEVLSEQIVQTYFQSHKNEGVAIPDFFQRMTAADAVSGTRISSEFIRVQQEIFTLYETSEVTFSFEEIRRATFLNDQLTTACSKAGIMEASVLEVRGANTSQTTIKKLNDLLEESAKSVYRKRRTSTQTGGKQENIPQKAARIEQSPDSVRSPKKKQKETPPSRNGRYTSMKATDLILPGWSRKTFQDKGDLEQDEEEYDDQQDMAKDDVRQKGRDRAKPTLEEALAELNGMVGLDAAKSQVESIVKFIKISKLREKTGQTPNRCPII